MTYEEISIIINQMSTENKQQDATVLVGDEFLPITRVEFSKDTDVLDVDHPYLVAE